MASLDILTQPQKIGTLTVPNRFVMSPMTRSFAPGGVPSLEAAPYYAARAEGNVGLVITEGVGIDHEAAIGDSGLGDSNQPVLHGEAALNRWREVVAAVHKAGGVIAPQLWHQGPLRINGTGLHPDALSCRPSPAGGPADRVTVYPPEVLAKLHSPTAAMSESAIADTIAAYARSAANAKAVGFDAIAIHGAHGYLIDAFLWEGSNQRRDQWGGTLANRIRYGEAVVSAIRAAVGADMPIIFRFSQWKQADFEAQIAPDPATLEHILGSFAAAGVDAFDASCRRYEVPAFARIDARMSLAGWAKKLTGKPAMAVGGIGLQADIYESMGAGGSAYNANINDVAQRIEQGEFDFAVLGRALLSEPHWPAKVLAGQPCKPFSMADLAHLR